MDSGRKTNHSESKNVDDEYKEDKYLSNHNNSQLLKKYIHYIKNSKTNIDCELAGFGETKR